MKVPPKTETKVSDAFKSGKSIGRRCMRFTLCNLRFVRRIETFVVLFFTNPAVHSNLVKTTCYRSASENTLCLGLEKTPCVSAFDENRLCLGRYENEQTMGSALQGKAYGREHTATS